jgi:hypothetical protein
LNYNRLLYKKLTSIYGALIEKVIYD